jgi:cytidylate kinase
MSIEIGLGKFPSFLSSELEFGGPVVLPRSVSARGVVTISRQSGCGAEAVGEKLAGYLEAHGPDAACPWKLFDKNLIGNVLAEHKLPRRLERFMVEDRASEVADMMDQLLGTHPPAELLVRYTAETVFRLAARGNVILIGRGANLITRKLPQALHVRLVASLEKRVERVRLIRDVPKATARELIRREDRARSRYLKKYFGVEVDDPLNYHLVLNTDLISFEKAARLIGDIVLKNCTPGRSEFQSIGLGARTR